MARVLVVDDTVVYRKAVSDVLAELPDVEVVGAANNGKIAMSKLSSLKPDLLTLDIEMPEMNGLDVLASIKSEALDVGTIVLSTLTHKAGDMTMQALELGAFDFITKPDSILTRRIVDMKTEIIMKVKAVSRVKLDKIDNEFIKETCSSQQYWKIIFAEYYFYWNSE